MFTQKFHSSKFKKQKMFHGNYFPTTFKNTEILNMQQQDFKQSLANAYFSS